MKSIQPYYPKGQQTLSQMMCRRDYLTFLRSGENKKTKPRTIWGGKYCAESGLLRLVWNYIQHGHCGWCGLYVVATQEGTTKLTNYPTCYALLVPSINVWHLAFVSLLEIFPKLHVIWLNSKNRAFDILFFLKLEIDFAVALWFVKQSFALPCSGGKFHAKINSPLYIKSIIRRCNQRSQIARF